MPKSGSHVALLRGINVGGKNKLPMKDLRALFETAGCANVRSYIQSGNVVFQAPPAVAKTIGSTIEADIATELGLKVPVVVRSAAQWAKILTANPYADRDVDPKFVFVGMMSDKPARTRIAELDPNRSPGDEFTVHGREIYMCCPNGVARSKLTNAYFDAKLGVVTTFRNSRTMSKIDEMLAG